MSKFYLILLAGFLSCSLYSCKKDNRGADTANNSSAFSKLIIGKWLAVKGHAKVYYQQGALAKDTTEDITNTWDNAAWYEVYNADLSGYKIYLMAGTNTPLPDTNLNYRYAIYASTLSLLPRQEAAYNESILSLDSTSMVLEDTYVSNIANPNWGLNPSITYQFIIDTYYKKQ